MTDDKTREELRQKAEEILQQKTKDEDLSKAEKDKLIHELQVHQIELEMQNDELIHIQQEMERSRSQYASLFNQAPVGYVVLDKNAMIHQANYTLIDLLKKDNSDIINTNFLNYVHQDDKQIFAGRYKAFYNKPQGKIIDVHLVAADKKVIAAEIIAAKDYHNNFASEPNDGKKLLVSIVDVTEKRKTLKNLQIADKKLQLAMQAANEGMWEWNLQTNNVYFDDIAIKMLGYERDDITNEKLQGTWWMQQVHPDDLQEMSKRFDDYVNGRINSYGAEFRLKKKDGSYCWVASHGRVLSRNTAHEPEIVIGIHRNITPAKNAEFELKEKERLLGSTGKMAKVGGWELDAETQKVTWSEETYKIHEVPLDQEPPLEDAINFFHPEDRPILQKALQNALEKAVPYDLILRFKTAKGKELITHTKCEPIVVDGKVIKLYGTFQDITERKQAEMQLLAAEQRYHSILNKAPAVVFVKDKDGKYIYVNRLYEELNHISLEKIKGLTDHDVFKKELADAFRENDLKVLATGKPISVEEKVNYDDGIHTVISTKFPLFDENKETYAVCGIATDITDRKETEELVRKQSDEIQSILQSMLNAFVIFDSVFDENGKFISYRFVYINKAYEEITGVKNDEVKGKTVHEVWPGTEESWIEKYGHVAVTGETLVFENYHDPTKKLYHCRVYRPWETNKRFCVIFEDITEQKKLTEEIETLWNVSPDLICVADYNTAKFIRVNPAFSTTMGYSEEELLNRSFLEFVHPDDIKPTLTVMEDKLKKGIPILNFTNRYICKDGSFKYLDWVSRPIKEKGLTYAIARDVTAQVEAQEALRESQAFNQKLLNTTPDLIYIYDILEYKNVYSNAGLVKVLGYSQAEIDEMGSNVIPFLMHPDDLKIYLEVTYPKYKNLKDGEILQHQYRMKHKKGHFVWLESKEQIYLREEDGSVKQIFGVVRDISENRKSQEEIIDAKETAERYLDMAGSMILNLDLDGNIALINQKGLEILEYDHDELIGNNWFDTCIPKEINKDIKKVFSQIVKGEIESLDHFENEVVSKSGKHKIISWYNTVIRNHNGYITSILSSGIDITKIKQTQEELLRSFSLQQATLESTADGLLVVDLEGRIVDYNNRFLEIWELSDDTIQDGDKKDLVSPQNAEFAMNHILGQLIDPEQFIAKVQELYSKPESESFDVLKFKNGKTIERYSKPQYLNDVPVGRVWSFRDVTERKQAEEEIKRFSRIFKDSLNEIFLFDADTLKFKHVNSAAINNLGYSHDELLNMTPYDIKPEFTLADFEALIKPLRNGSKDEIVFVTLHQRKDESQYDVEVHLQLMTYENSNMFVAIIIDITERKKTEKELEKHREHLEELVQERTAELKEKNADLMRYNKLFIGREFRIKELKDKVKELETKLEDKV